MLSYFDIVSMLAFSLSHLELVKVMLDGGLITAWLSVFSRQMGHVDVLALRRENFGEEG